MGALLPGCGRSDLGLLMPHAASDGGSGGDEAGGPMDASFDVAPGDGAADSPTADAGRAVDVTCPHLAGLQAHAPWPTAGRCPGRTASTPVVGPRSVPSIVWSQKATGSWTWTEPVIAADGTIYAFDSGRGLVAMTQAGATKWTTPLSVDSQSSTVQATLAIRSDGAVYVLASATLFTIGRDGTVADSLVGCGRGLGFEVEGDGTVDFLQRCASRDVVLDLLGSSDALLSSRSNLALTLSIPALASNGALQAIGAKNDQTPSLFSFNPDGSLAWTVDASGLIADPFTNGLRSPIVRDDDTIVFEDPAGTHAVSPDGSVLWTADVQGMLAAGVDGTVYVALGALVALHPDGTKAWQWAAADSADTHPIVGGDGTVYAAAEGGIVAIGSGGTLLWQTKAASAPCAIDAAGTLYAIDSTGTVLSAMR